MSKWKSSWVQLSFVKLLLCAGTVSITVSRKEHLSLSRVIWTCSCLPHQTKSLPRGGVLISLLPGPSPAVASAPSTVALAQRSCQSCAGKEVERPLSTSQALSGPHRTPHFSVPTPGWMLFPLLHIHRDYWLCFVPQKFPPKLQASALG